MTLKEKLERWRDLQAAADKLAEEIKAEVLELQQTIRGKGVVASYGKGRGSYDYEAIAKEIQPPRPIIEKWSTLKVNWRGVVEEAGVPPEIKAKYYKPGTPYVSLRLKVEDAPDRGARSGA